MDWITPEKLFVCTYKSSPESSQRSAKLWNEGVALPPEKEAIRNEHLRHVNRISQKGITFAAGPFRDFSGGIRILSVNSVEEARSVTREDPFFKHGHHYGDEYHEWIIHMPLDKASALHKEWLTQSLKVIGINHVSKTPQWTTPEKLFVCLCKRRQDQEQRAHGPGAGLSPEEEAVRNEHLRYAYALGEKGITWAGGPFKDNTGTLSIYAVNSLEEAREAKRKDPFYQNGYLYDDVYHEWMIHGPFEKASPDHKEFLRKSHLKAGVKL